MRIVQISDLHLDDFLTERYAVDTRFNALRTLDAAQAAQPDLVVLSGDLGEPESHGWLFEALRVRSLSFAVLLGNHDEWSRVRVSPLVVHPSVAEAEYYYSLTFDAVQLLFLDTGKGSVSDEQRTWLSQQLTQPATQTIVFCHHPLLDTDPVLERVLGLKPRHELVTLLQKATRPVAIFAGHYHCASSTITEGLRQYVCPASIMQIASRGDTLVTQSFDSGYQVIEAGPQAVTVERRVFVSNRQVNEGE